MNKNRRKSHKVDFKAKNIIQDKATSTLKFIH